MVLMRIRLLLALAAVAVIVGGAIVGGAVAVAGGGVAGGAARGGGATRGSRVTVPAMRAEPEACFVAGQACSIHPCVEFVAPLRVPTVKILPRRRLICASYPGPGAQAVRIRR